MLCSDAATFSEADQKEEASEASQAELAETLSQTDYRKEQLQGLVPRLQDQTAT